MAMYKMCLAKTVELQDTPLGQALYMKKYMERPPGCSFLGEKATTATELIGKQAIVGTPIIIDSGSDITLISHKTLQTLPVPPKIKTGERVNLIQVTGSATLAGYVSLPISFPTMDGPVILEVEAYVVTGMNTAFILGNDFGDQYQLSILCNEGRSFIVFGDTGQRLEVFSSVSPSLVDEEGNTFKVSVQHPAALSAEKIKLRKFPSKPPVRSDPSLGLRVVAKDAQIIRPGSVLRVPVSVPFPAGTTCLYVERLELRNRNSEAFFGAPDSLIQHQEKWFCYIAHCNGVACYIATIDTIVL